MIETRSLDVAQLVARALPAERPLVVALAGLDRAPRLRVGLEVDGHRIGLAVEQDGQRLAVLVGRTEAGHTAADKAMDEALGRAGWPVYRVTPGRVATRPMQAVADVLAALRERGADVPARVPAKRREPVGALRPWWEVRDEAERERPAVVDTVAVSITAPANEVA